MFSRAMNYYVRKRHHTQKQVTGYIYQKKSNLGQKVMECHDRPNLKGYSPQKKNVTGYIYYKKKKKLQQMNACDLDKID